MARPGKSDRAAHSRSSGYRDFGHSCHSSQRHLRSDHLRHRVRYFCDGAVLGTAQFVDGVFAREQALRKRFGEKRTTGARRMRGADWGELRVLRDLQKDVIES